MNAEASAAPTLTLAHAADRRREHTLTALRIVTRVAFSAVVVLSPLRARFELLSRPDVPVYGDYTDFLLYWSDVAFIAFLALWACDLAISGRRPWLGPGAIRWPVFLLLAATLLSVPFSFDPALSLYYLLRLVAAAALALYVANEVDGIGQLLPALVTLVALQAAVGIYQAFEQGSLGLYGLGELRLQVNAGGTSVVWSDEGPRQLRAYGLTDHPNILGGLLAIALLLIGAGVARVRGGLLPLLVAAFALGCAGLLVTFSRGAGLALMLGGATVFGLLAYRCDWPSFRRWALACVVAAVACLALIPPFGEYFTVRADVLESSATSSTEAQSLNEREALARVTNDIFVAHPLVGVGAGGLPSAMKDAYPDFSYNYQPAHFALLTVATETGLLGGMAFGALIVVPLVLVYWRRRELTPELIGATGALVAVTVIGLLDYYTWSLAPGRIWYWLVLGLWVAAYAGRDKVATDA